MLRPATPLSVLLLAAFVLLLLSVLSVPIVSSIPLGENGDFTYGVFGYCQDGKGCSDIGIGYSTDQDDFDLPNSVRDTLSAILVIHPVAALITLVMLVAAVVSHLHGPAHSARYLLLLFIFLILDFVVSLVAFIMDLLVFMPHMAWGTYITLAATVIIGCGAVVSCCMRRTVVGRKARQKRIAENAEMSGENYYNREANNAPAPVPTQPTVPLVSRGVAGANDSLPAFATFESQKKDDQSEERVPLTQRSPSERTPSRPPADNAMHPTESVAAAYGAPPNRQPSRDRYGNPIPPSRDPSFDRMNSRSRDIGPGGYRGRPGYGRGSYDNYSTPRSRGGYGPPPRGGYGPRPARGGYGPPPRGAYPPGGMRGGRSPPPPQGYNNMGGPGPYDRRPSGAGSYDQPGAYAADAGPPGMAYSQNSGSNPSMPSTNNTYEPFNPDGVSLPRAESPPPLLGAEHREPGSEAIEMDATPVEGQRGFGQYGSIRDSDTDVAGMVGLQQGQAPGRHDTYMSEGSKYSTDEHYVPPRNGWNQNQGRNSPKVPSPLNVQHPFPGASSSSELPVSGSPAASRRDSSNYYEDVPPRFANPQPVHGHMMAPPDPGYADERANAGGSRSPAESERSNFTSISQRGINPRWNPPPMPQQQQQQYMPNMQRRQQQRQDMILDNPDFQVPGMARGSPKRGAGPGGPGMIPGSAYPTGGF